MSLSEFDKQTVELVPEEMIILRKIELPQYEVQEDSVSLEYMNEGNLLLQTWSEQGHTSVFSCQLGYN